MLFDTSPQPSARHIEGLRSRPVTVSQGTSSPPPSPIAKTRENEVNNIKVYNRHSILGLVTLCIDQDADSSTLLTLLKTKQFGVDDTNAYSPLVTVQLLCLARTWDDRYNFPSQDLCKERGGHKCAPPLTQLF